MSVFAQPGETHIRKMRVISGDRDELSLRLRIAGALSEADLQPASLPRSAIACINKLSDPLPGALRFGAGNPQAPRAWERAVAESLDRMVRRAARPALGYVPINAEAVVFLDRAELLACFASDWLEGAAATRWWWRGLFRTVDMASVVRAWMEAPEYAPAALARLAVGGKAVRFVSSLGGGDSRLLLTGIIRRFALRELAAAFDIVLNENGAARWDTNGAAPQGSLNSARARQSPPWQQWANETEARELEIGQESLLATGLMLVRAPGAVRSKSFAEEVVRWHRARTRTAREANQSASPVSAMNGTVDDRSLSIRSPFDRVEQNPRPHLSDAVQLAVQPSARRGESGNAADLVTGIAGRSNEMAGSRLAETELEQGPSAAPAQPPASAALSSLEHPDLSGETGPAIPLPGQSSKSKLEPEVERSTTQGTSAQSSLGLPFELSTTINPAILLTGQDLRSAAMLEAEIETRLGGVFYLINLGLFLNLYGDFTTPAQPGIDLPIWDFIALAGMHLTGGRIEAPGSASVSPAYDVVMAVSERQARRLRSQAEPVWSLLARLSGRNEDDPPGEEFRAPESWRLPAEWLASFQDECIWQWERSDDRLRVWHPEGFLVVDVPTEGGPEEQLTRETRDYQGIAGFEFSPRSAHAASASRNERWIGWLMPYLRARLVRALGLADPDCLQRMLLEHRARVSVTAAHLDVYFSLEEHPIEIRLAGLDRDAGWVPAAGRYVAFHFE